jgi:hypothetical protein
MICPQPSVPLAQRPLRTAPYILPAMPAQSARIASPDYVSRLRLRPFVREDASEALSLLPAWVGLDAGYHQRLIGLWQRLAYEAAMVSAVHEDMALPAGHRLQAWGVTMVLPPAWLAQCMPGGQADPARCSHATHDVYRALLDGRLALPTEREIGRANAGDGVVFLAMHYSQHERDLTQAYALRMLNMANEGLRVSHAGYRIRAFFMQATLADEPWVQSAGLRRRHEPTNQAAATQTLLYGLTHEEATTMLPGQSARALFEHQAPRFRLSASQRRLLWLSLFDEQDEALMQQLDVSGHGLKKLWRGIYERIDDVEPEFFGDARDDSEGKRGPEKRRRVLAYMRQRPEELRPWATRA